MQQVEYQCKLIRFELNRLAAASPAAVDFTLEANSFFTDDTKRQRVEDEESTSSSIHAPSST